MTGELQLDYQRNRPYTGAGVLLLVFALAALFASGIYYRNLSIEVELWEARVEQNKHAAQKLLPGGRSDIRLALGLAQEVEHANEILRKLSMPWYGLLQTIESAGGKGVALLALEPDTEKRLVRISGEAKNIAAMLDYIRKLEKRDLFGTVYLQSHHVQLQDPEKPVRFVLLAIWRVKS
jgi:crotonobetainyl-CoA:carnitine CoA-transferase CaiB-like acyl-CoA transferase